MSAIHDYLAARQAGHPQTGPAGNARAMARVRRCLQRIEREAGKELLDFTSDDALRLVPFLDGYAENSRAYILATVRHFFEWAIAEGRYTDANPFWLVGRNDMSPHRADRLPWRELNRIYSNATKAFDDKANGQTVQLVIGLMGLAGMRIEEVLDLQKDDVRDDGVVVRRDGRFVPLAPKLMTLLHKVSASNLGNSPYIVRGNSPRMRDDEPLSPPPMNVKINAVYDKLGIDRSRIKPMSLRETFLARAEEKLDNPAMLLTLVGHPQVTRQPTIPSFSKDEIKQAYKRVVE